MKLYETGRLLLEPLLPPLYKQVRRRLSELIRSFPGKPQILDVGGRKSPYTIGLPCAVTLIDLPRESELQHKLNLGIDDQIIAQIQNRRSNVEKVIFGDMTCSGLPSESFDLIVAVEVLEHVEKDQQFVSEVCRVLKTGGVFLMTTPNGDWLKNTNPDHKRHYRKQQLSGLLERYFDRVSVDYAIVGGYYRKIGLKSWSLHHPWQTALSMYGNALNARQSGDESIKMRATNTHHLIAAAHKGRSKSGRGIF